MRSMLLLSLTLSLAAGTQGPLLLQKPTLNRTQVVFSYAGDLWSVSREGGDARRLTTGPGVESNPVFSPDGTQIAFTGEYDGNVDVYVMPAQGGTPRRLTYHPAPDQVQGWSPDGKRILFASRRTANSRYQELFTLGLEGGLPERIPLPTASEGTFAPKGTHLAYVPLDRPFNVWKRYRGGLATAIWLADLATSKVEALPRKDSNDFNPMWVGDQVYFLSDREGPATLFCYGTKGKEVTRLLPSSGEALKSASAGPGAIVYEQFGGLGLFDLKTRKATPLAVNLAGDLPEIRERFVRVGQELTNPALSPSGARAVFEAHGEILTVPAAKGDPRNLTETPGVMERDPAWSPDGKSIAYFSDASGEYALHLRPQDGKGPATIITLAEKPTLYFSPTWSPDSRKIAYTDAHLSLWYVDVTTKKPIKVDQDRFYSLDASLFHPTWSPDSRWLGYAKRLPNYLGAIFVHDTTNGTNSQLTDGMSDAQHPAFDAGGKYLYFTASTDSGASLQPDILSARHPTSRGLYLAVLSKAEPSPYAPESDEEKGEGAGKKPEAPEKKGEPEAKAPAGDAKAPKPPEGPRAPKVAPVRLDLDQLSQRILPVPLPPGNYRAVMTGKAGVVFALETSPGSPGLTVRRHDLKARKSDVAASGVDAFVVSAQGEKVLTRQARTWSIAPLRPLVAGNAPTPPPPPPTGGGLKTDTLEVRVDPRAEWKQMYREAWRIQREFFYDPNHHGLDLEKMERHYAAYLPQVASRSDLNYLMSEMLGEVTVSHLGVGGGALPEVRRVGTGLLGADYTLEQGRYRFARVFNGESWNPQLRAPLTQPGVNVVAGEYLLEVNGQPLTADKSVFSYFQATVGKAVTLRVGPNPNAEGSREVTVVPVESEAALRHLAWIEDNRRYVDKVSGGRVGYLYMPDTSTGGYTNFNRFFYPQVGKEALIVDERYNGGGALATDIIELLKRPLMSKVATRDGVDEVQPQGAIFGPKVMLINEPAGSGGDAMPYYFRKAGVGKLVGKRTWGGLVGRAAGVPLMDGGRVGTPTSGVWDPHTRQWIAENIGVSPDVEVELDPEMARKGKDAQLDKAIELLMAELPKTPPAPVKRPDYPVYKR